MTRGTVLHAARPGEVCELYAEVIATQSFPRELDSVRAARHVTVGLLDRASRLAEDAAIVVTELAANAVVHARSGFTLTLTRSKGSVTIAVRDDRPLVPQQEGRPFDVKAGHGLSVVAQVALAWAVESRPDGKVVWAKLAAR